MDSLDLMLLSALLKHSRTTWTELASHVDLSIPSVTERVKKLEEQGIIKDYTLRLDYQQLGYHYTAFVFVTLAGSKHRKAFIQQIKKMPEVLMGHHVTGDDDFLLQVICKDSNHLDNFLNESIKGIDGVARTKTMIALAAIKEYETQLPK